MATQAGPLQAWSGLSPGLQRTRWEACVLINTATKEPENERTHGSDGQQKLLCRNGVDEGRVWGSATTSGWGVEAQPNGVPCPGRCP